MLGSSMTNMAVTLTEKYLWTFEETATPTKKLVFILVRYSIDGISETFTPARIHTTSYQVLHKKSKLIVIPPVMVF